jgi:preprotein translocase subunit SecG
MKNLDESPPEGIKIIVNDDDFTTICADIEGPGEILSRVTFVFIFHYFGCALFHYFS